MNSQSYEEKRKMYLDIIKDMKKDEEKIKYLKDIKFSIAMIDRWQDEDYVIDKVIFDLLKELGDRKDKI